METMNEKLYGWSAYAQNDAHNLNYVGTLLIKFN